MPNWKKIITSGSDAVLNSLAVTTFLTTSGSLNVTGSSIFKGPISVTGSLSVSSSFTASGLNYPAADNGEESFMQTDGNGNLSLQYVKTIYEEIVNGESTQLVKGTPVYVSGSQGAAAIVYRADPLNPLKMPVVYIAADTLAANEAGRGIALGLIKGVNTTGYPAGSEIYLAAGGGWTLNRPTGSAIVQVLGYVTKEGNGGQGVVLNPGPANLPNLPSGSVWVGNSSSVPVSVLTSSLSVNSASFALTASYVNPLTQSVFITGSLDTLGTITATQIGAGVAPSGSVRLDVRAQGALSTDIPFRIRNSADSANLLTMQGDGNIRIGTDVTTTFKLDVNGFVRVGGGAGTAGQLQIASGTGQYYPTLTWVNNGSSTQGQIAGYGGGLYTQNTGYFQFTNIGNVTVGGAYGGRDASALFQVNGTTKGSIPWPRMTAAQRIAITSPVLGLTVYQTDGIEGIYVYTSTGWILNTLTPFPYTGSAQITGSLNITGSLAVTQNITGSRMFLSSSNGTVSGSTLTVYGSGSAQPVFTVQGSQGELFSITDSLSGSLFSVNDISGLPILEVFSNGTTLIGNYADPMLITTTYNREPSGLVTIYSLPTSSYDTAFFDYSVRSGSNARAGQIMAIQSGSTVNYTETTTVDFGSTSGVSLGVFVSGSNMVLTGSTPTSGWVIKTIVRAI